MLVDKPDWVSHDGQPIFSIDVHPDGTRLATAGQDAKVKIWNLQPILRQDFESDTATPKLLATLADHQQAVNVVRFSPNGAYLASGSDDNSVFVWELRTGPGRAVFGSSDGPSIENWAFLAQLRGHRMNVCDVCWCPNSQLLASASYDNLVNIWDAAAGRLVHTLRGHKSFVKGVAWDPINKYLASQGEDRRVIIWNTETWQEVTVITDPLTKAPNAPYHSRLSWSVVGDFLAVVNAYADDLHTCALVTRQSWEKQFTLCGHTKIVTAARYNPKLLITPSTDGSEPTARQCVALASVDRRLTVWLGQQKPLFIAESFFKESVMDVAWTPNGYCLFACSRDGTLVACQFTEQELGRPATETEVNEMLTAMYGAHPAERKRHLAHSAEEIIQPEHDTTAAAVKEQPLTSSSLHNRIAPPKGVETGFAPASKRITPVAVTTARTPPPAPQSKAQPNSAQAAFTGTAAGASTGALQLQQHAVILNVPEPPNVLHAKLGLRNGLLDGDKGTQVALQAINGYNTRARRHEAEVVCTEGAHRAWSDFVDGVVVACCGTLNFSAVATKTGSLVVYSTAGRRVLPGICLGAAAAMVWSKAWRLLVLTVDGELRLWDIQQRTLVLQTSVAPLANTAGAKVATIGLTESGAPLLIMSNMHAYVHHETMKCWMCVADDSYPGSVYRLSLPGAADTELSRLAANANAASTTGAAAFMTSFNKQYQESRSHLEHMLAAAELTENAADYRRWLIAYVRNLACGQDIARLRELCENLLRSPNTTGNASQQQLLGMDRHKLFKEVLKEISRAQQPETSKLFSEMQTLLKESEQNTQPNGRNGSLLLNLCSANRA